MRFRAHQAAAHVATRRLLLLFALVLVLLVFAVNAALALIYRLTFPWASGYPAYFFETNTGLVLLFVLGGCVLESLRLREGGRHVARLVGGRAVSGEEGAAPRDRYEQRLLNVVAEMAIASRLPMPQVYVLPREEGINAFAAGWGPEDAVLAVTHGALMRLTREELQGVVAHEFAHIGHGDMRLNMRLIGLVWGLQMVHTFGHALAEPDELGRRPASTPFGLALMAVGALGWMAGRVLKAAVSRQREYLADASAVQYTRNVEGLGGALRKIADQLRHHRQRWVSAQAEPLSHLFFSPGGGGWPRTRLSKIASRGSTAPRARRCRPCRCRSRPMSPCCPSPPWGSPPVAARPYGRLASLRRRGRRVGPQSKGACMIRCSTRRAGVHSSATARRSRG